jgi:hypothetical protein
MKFLFVEKGSEFLEGGQYAFKEIWVRCLGAYKKPTCCSSNLSFLSVEATQKEHVCFPKVLLEGSISSRLNLN